MSVYGPVLASRARQLVHGFTTTPGMIGVITCAVAASLAAILVMLATHDPGRAGVVGGVGFVVLNIALITVVSGNIRSFWMRMNVLFPKDPGER